MSAFKVFSREQARFPFEIASLQQLNEVNVVNIS